MVTEDAADSWPLVSVVIPTYGRPEMLTEAVGTVCEQTYPYLELIVVDDCSPTPARETLDGVDLSGNVDVDVRRHEQNRGANVARNTGISVASGDLIAFLDDDDLWHPEKIEKQVAVFRENSTDVGLVYTGQRYVDDDGETTNTVQPTTAGDATEQVLRGAAVGPFSTLMIRAGVVGAVGDLDERLPSWQDRDFVIRVSCEFHLKPVPEPLVVRRMGSHEQIADEFEEKRDVTYPLFVEKHRPLAAEFGRRTERRFLATTTQSLAGSALKNGFYFDAIKYALRIIRYEPLSATGYLYLILGSGGDLTYKSARQLKRTYAR